MSERVDIEESASEGVGAKGSAVASAMGEAGSGTGVGCHQRSRKGGCHGLQRQGAPWSSEARTQQALGQG
ncbi:unnamed protein product [Ilex paraguariensis]|uniref:Uncharacterized protein n=1 Tax=Ilex paraguariensis TaxID=185542 RepID=A0ABC8SSN7_9AQUA